MKTKNEVFEDIKIISISLVISICLLIIAHAFIYTLAIETSFGDSLGIIIYNLLN